MNDGRIDARVNELEAQLEAMTERLHAAEAKLAEHLARCPGSTDEDRVAAAGWAR
jgi:hypothetical protein